MRLEKIQRQRVPSFGGVLNNKALLKGLEKVSEHGATFGATACLVGSLALRPLAIQATPKAKKENKQYASANSICSGLMKFAVAEAIVLPIENAVKKIDKNPEQFLKKETILNLKSTADNLIDSKTYKFATQIVKLGAGFLAAIPKSMLTVALIPLAVNTLFKPKTKKEEHSPQQVNFKGAIGNKIAKGVGKI